MLLIICTIIGIKELVDCFQGLCEIKDKPFHMKFLIISTFTYFNKTIVELYLFMYIY